MRFDCIHNANELAVLIDKVGFLPFFKNEIEGFSIEEITPPELWFGDVEGPWEWKGPVIHMSGAAYGKFYCGKAMYVSKDWFRHFANYRRDGYDFDSRVDEGIAKYKDAKLYATLERMGPSLSKALKAAAGYSGEGRLKGFDGVVTRLQMMCYVVIADFEYEVDKNDNRYGWGVARYAVPEQLYGENFRKGLYSVKPSVSYEKMLEHLKSLLPDVSEDLIRKLLG